MARETSTVVRPHDNTRDLGGLPVPGGGAIRPGRVWRGAAHDLLVPTLARTGPLHFFDLRRDTELGAFPGRSDRRHHWPLEDPAGHRRSPSERDDDYYVETSLALLPHLGGCLVDVCTTLVSSADPVFIGCRLGKDRTGFVVIVLCILLGVPPDAIVADHLRTGDSFRRSPDWVREYAAARGEDTAEVLRRLSPSPDIPTRILTALPDQESLRDGLGISRELLQRTRAAVVS